MIENCSRLLIHISKTQLDQMILAVEIAVQGSGRNPRQITDILDAYSLKAVLTHGLHCCENDPRFGVIQSNHVLLKLAIVTIISLSMYYTLFYFR